MKKENIMKNQVISLCNQALTQVNISPINIVLHGSQTNFTKHSEVDVLVLVKNEIERKKAITALKNLRKRIWIELTSILDFNIIEQKVLQKDSVSSFYFTKILQTSEIRLHGSPKDITEEDMLGILNFKFQYLKTKYPEIKFEEKIGLAIFLYLEKDKISLPYLYKKSRLFEWFEKLESADEDFFLIKELINISKSPHIKILSKFTAPESQKIQRLDKFIHSYLKI